MTKNNEFLKNGRVIQIFFWKPNWSTDSHDRVISLWGCHMVDWCFLDSRGASKGIFLMWIEGW